MLLNDKVVNQGINLPIDIFLRSLAEDQGEKTIAIILSGTGSDGTRGVRAIKEMGGMVMVQDEESAKFDGMPRAAISTGVADYILPPDKMPEQLLAYVAHPYVSGEKHSDLLLKDADALTRLFAELREKTKADFTYYKPSTIARHLREMVVFAQHNLVKDPPFTNIDLISCRNLLIYLQPILQQKAFEMFNFSLNHEGILFLGTSETTGEMATYFENLHQKHKIYRSLGKTQPMHRDLQTRTRDDRNYPTQPFTTRGRDRRFGESDSSRIIKQYLDVASSLYLPLSVVVNERLEIVHIVGNTEGYFRIPSGPAEYDITKMATRDLAIPLATGIQKVFRSGQEISYTNIRLQHRNQDHTIRIRIVPLAEAKGHEPLLTVFFEEIDLKQQAGQESVTYDASAETQQRISDLEQELQFARENLQATIEELETSNEELQATNEELLASNEELQSTNEELQSTNEELYTVNAEHQNKIIELTELNNDVDNLLTSSRIGTLLLDEDLEIRKFSPEVTNIFHIMEKDIGRPVTHIAHRLQNFDPVAMIKTVKTTNQPVEQEIQAEGDRWYLARILPYAIGPNAYSGVVLTFINISDARLARTHLANSRQTTSDISEFIPAGLFIYSQDSAGDLILESCNPEAERITGIRATESVGRGFIELWPNAEKIGLADRFKTVIATGKACYLEDISYQDDNLNGSYRIHAFRIPDNRLAVSFECITERNVLRRELEESERKYRTLFETMAQGVVYQDRQGRITSANPAAERILGMTFDQMRGITSTDPRWQAIREDGSSLPGEEHPSMIALRTGKPVFGFIMGIHSPAFTATRFILVNATPQFEEGEDQAYQVYTTFEDKTRPKNRCN